MITDLAEEINHDVMVETDVLIVGAGIAGIFLAVRLRRLGIRVVILESGSRTQAEKVHPLNRVIQLGDRITGRAPGASAALAVHRHAGVERSYLLLPAISCRGLI